MKCWDVYLSSSTAGESRGASRSSRSLNNRDVVIAKRQTVQSLYNQGFNSKIYRIEKV